MPINLSEVTAIIRQVDKLYQLSQLADPSKRWEALQEALKTNPRLNKLIETNLKKKPSEVFDSLLTEYNIDSNALDLAHSLGLLNKNQLRRKVETNIATIQTLYKERKKADA